MHLWILRHGEAERETRRDPERTLTELGSSDARAAGEFLAGVGRSTAPRFLASPYVRAQQTAQCALESFPGTPLQTVDWLIPDADPLAALQALADLPAGDEVVLVSHQPLVSALGGLLAAGDFRAGPAMGTASLAEFELELVGRGSATLLSLRHAPDYLATAG
jgi:phosphohistidine phosphatase